MLNSKPQKNSIFITVTYLTQKVEITLPSSIPTWQNLIKQIQSSLKPPCSKPFRLVYRDSDDDMTIVGDHDLQESWDFIRSQSNPTFKIIVEDPPRQKTPLLTNRGSKLPQCPLSRKASTPTMRIHQVVKNEERCETENSFSEDLFSRVLHDNKPKDTPKHRPALKSISLDKEDFSPLNHKIPSIVRCETSRACATEPETKEIPVMKNDRPTKEMTSKATLREFKFEETDVQEIFDAMQGSLKVKQIIMNKVSQMEKENLKGKEQVLRGYVKYAVNMDSETLVEMLSGVIDKIVKEESAKKIGSKVQGQPLKNNASTLKLQDNVKKIGVDKNNLKAPKATVKSSDITKYAPRKDIGRLAADTRSSQTPQARGERKDSLDFHSKKGDVAFSAKLDKGAHKFTAYMIDPKPVASMHNLGSRY